MTTVAAKELRDTYDSLIDNSGFIRAFLAAARERPPAQIDELEIVTEAVRLALVAAGKDPNA